LKIREYTGNVIKKNNDLREAVVTDAFLFLSTFFIQSTKDILTV